MILTPLRMKTYWSFHQPTSGRTTGASHNTIPPLQSCTFSGFRVPSNEGLALELRNSARDNHPLSWITICSCRNYQYRIEGSWLKQHPKSEEQSSATCRFLIKWSHFLSIPFLTCLHLHQSVQQGKCQAWNACAAPDKNVTVHHDHPLLLYTPQETETQVILFCLGTIDQVRGHSVLQSVTTSM